MTALDDLPDVDSFFGIDLKTGSMIIAAIGIVHPMAYGCSFYMPMSYILVTVWIMVALYFAASIVLLCGLIKDSPLLCSIWVWYALVFAVVMIMLMILLTLVFTSRKQRNRVLLVIFGMLWYILTIYFILVVNSYRKKLAGNTAHIGFNLSGKNSVDMAVIPMELTTRRMRSINNLDTILNLEKVADKTNNIQFVKQNDKLLTTDYKEWPKKWLPLVSNHIY